MVLRFFFRYLANNERVVSRLAESYPIRRAAQLVVYLFTRGQQAAQNPQLSAVRLRSFIARLQAELQDARKEMTEASKELKKRQQK
jgi:mediator of RNA polymerase II transcription subunit 9